MSKKPIIYIALEGMEGAGKSSVVTELVEQLSWDGYEVEYVAEPGSTPMAMDIRSVVKKKYPGEVIDPMTELMLFYAARKQLLINRVKPELDAGKIVITDRSYLSSLAYQGYGGGLIDECLLLEKLVVGDLKPTLTIYLDVDPEVGLARVGKRDVLDRIEENDLDYFNRVRSCFKLESLRPDVFEVNANGSFSSTYASVIGIVLNHISEKGYTNDTVDTTC